MSKTRKIAVTINKGGSTKTTTAVHLAAALAEEGKKVLLIDSDPQSEDGNVAKHLGLADVAKEIEMENSMSLSLYDFVVKGDRKAIIPARKNLFVIRGGFSLNALRRDIDNRQLGGHLVFSEAFEPIEHIFDYIIFDTPPSWDSLNINTLFYVDEIIIPINLEGMTISNLLDYLKRNLKDIQKYRPKPLKWGYALPTRHDRRTKQSEELLDQISLFFNEILPKHKELSEQYSKTILCDPIRYNVRISEASTHGQTVFEYESNSNGANDYRNFARRVSENGK